MGPKTLDEWYSWTLKLDNQWKNWEQIQGRTRENWKWKENPKRFYFRKEEDSNRMDVDALTFEERGRYMKEGLCFGCGGPGHLSKQCPNKKGKKKMEEPKKKMGGPELYRHIRNMFKEMDTEEQEKFMEHAKEEGF